MPSINILNNINKLFQNIFTNDYEETKKKLVNSPSSNSFLYLPALRWRSFSSPLKKLTWALAIIVPLVLGFFFTVPLIGAALGFASVISLFFLSYEENLIQVDINRYELNEKLTECQEKEQAELNNIDLSKQKHQKWELDHNFDDPATWGLEQNSKNFKDFKEILIKPENSTRTKALIEVSKNIRMKSDKILLKRFSNKKRANDFLINMQNLHEKYAQKDFPVRQIAINVNKNPIEQVNLNEQTFTWTFHVRTINDFRNYCQDNLTKLLFLFQKIQENGLMVVCKVSTDNLQHNDGAIEHQDKTEENQSLSDALANTKEANNSSISDIVPVNSPKKKEWQLNFTVKSKHNQIESSTKKRLEARSIDDHHADSSIWALRLLDFNSCDEKIKPDTSVATSSTKNALQEISDLVAITSQNLVDDETYNNDKEFLDSIETDQQRTERLEREELKFQDMMSSFNR